MSDAKDRENLAALEALRIAGQDRPRAGDPFPALPSKPPVDDRQPPGPTPPPRPTSGPAGRRASAGTRGHSVRPHAAGPKDPPIDHGEDEPPYRCLRCGYGLFPEGGLRCTECGEEYSQSVLERWFFDADERDRQTRILWLIHACLVVKLWLLPEITGFIVSLGCFGTTLFAANGLLALWACYLAARDRLDKIGGFYAIAGMVAAGMLCFGAFRSPAPAVYQPSLVKAILYSLDAFSGCMLLLALMHPPDGEEIWRSRSSLPYILGVAIGVPMVLMISYGVELRLFSGAAAPAPPVVSHINTTAIGALISIGIWVYVRQWVAGLRHAFYGRTARN